MINKNSQLNMNRQSKIILLLVFLLSVFLLVGLFLEAKDPDSFLRKQYRSLKVFTNDHLPKYSQKDLDQRIYKLTRHSKIEAFKTFEPFIIYEKVDLKLKLKQNRYQKEISDGSKVEVISYKANFLNLVKRVPEKGPAYIDFHSDKIIIAQENGLFFSVNREDFRSEKEEIFVTEVPSNIHSFTRYYEFFGSGQFGLKDILIHKNKIFVSIINERKKNCFNVSILQADILSNFEFSELYNPDDCVKLEWSSFQDHIYNSKNNKEFNAHQSGGRIVALNDNTLIISIGDFRNRSLSQNLQNKFGKIITINIDSGKTEIMSLGVRNSQGLYFSRKHQDLFHTEHGPNGGDELNFQSILKSKNPQNFGWPISSYGAHYGYGSYIESENGYELKERRKADIYKEFPLYKSHAKYGFKEPLIYFSPSIGISQIIEYSGQDQKNENNRKFVFGSMGYTSNNTSKDLSLYFLTLDKSLNIKFLDQLEVNGRIRDLIVDETNNDIFFSDDLNGSIGIIKLSK